MLRVMSIGPIYAYLRGHINAVQFKGYFPNRRKLTKEESNALKMRIVNRLQLEDWRNKLPPEPDVIVRQYCRKKLVHTYDRQYGFVYKVRD